MKKLTTLLTAGILASSWSLVAADANEHSEWDISKLDASKLPPAATAKNLTYAKDIKPMLEESCFRCHGEERQRGELRLDSLEALLKGGENGKIVQAGSSTKSAIVFASAQVNDDIAMPPKRGGRGGPGGRGGRGNFQPPPEVVKRFDKDGDGQLNETERQAMFEEFRAQRGGGPGGPGGRGPGGPGGPGGGRGQGGPGGGGRGPGGGPGGPPAKPLTAEQVGILRAWIDQGAK